ncbi:hypothetical protein N9X12_07715 [Alphaproteobacteria bacterium]|nr:hypothetical protein [Alphaproteobacteria bacterium]
MDNISEIQASIANMSKLHIEGDAICVVTHCLYPSFEPVKVYITDTKSGFRISDKFGAISCASDHGQNKHTTQRQFDKIASKFHTKTKAGEIYAEIPSIEWIPSAVLAVANGSAAVAENTISKVIKNAERSIRDAIELVFAKPIYRTLSIDKDVEIVGSSGKSYQFDFRLKHQNQNRQMIIAGVTAHHSSISHRYTAFADVINGGSDRANNIAVFDKGPQNTDNILMSQVADLVPVKSIDKIFGEYASA